MIKIKKNKKRKTRRLKDQDQKDLNLKNQNHKKAVEDQINHNKVMKKVKKVIKRKKKNFVKGLPIKF